MFGARDVFADRVEAGRRHAALLGHLAGEDVVVLGLPRGGVPVAAVVARALGAPLDVIMVRKLGVPYQRELAMGAIGEDGVRVLNPEIVRLARVDADEIAAIERVERTELERRTRRFRAARPRARLTGRVAVVVDDGIATGSSSIITIATSSPRRALCSAARRPMGSWWRSSKYRVTRSTSPASSIRSLPRGPGGGIRCSPVTSKRPSAMPGP